MEGTRVIVRCYDDEPRVCVVYQVGRDRVLVTSQDGLAKFKLGMNGPIPIGFTKDNVFEYSSVAEMEIKRRLHDTEGFDWGRLELSGL